MPRGKKKAGTKGASKKDSKKVVKKTAKKKHQIVEKKLDDITFEIEK